MSFEITDELLFEFVPLFEKIILECIPKNSELNHIFSKCFDKRMRMLIKRRYNIKPKKSKLGRRR